MVLRVHVDLQRLKTHHAALGVHVWSQRTVLLPDGPVVSVPDVGVTQVRVGFVSLFRRVRRRLAALHEGELRFVSARVWELGLVVLRTAVRGRTSGGRRQLQVGGTTEDFVLHFVIARDPHGTPRVRRVENESFQGRGPFASEARPHELDDAFSPLDAQTGHVREQRAASVLYVLRVILSSVRLPPCARQGHELFLLLAHHLAFDHVEEPPKRIQRQVL